MADPSFRHAGPTVICLACGADDQPRLLSEITALAQGLQGHAEVQTVTGRTTAMRANIPASHASRFRAALALAGAEVIGPVADDAPPAFVILLTIELTAQQRNPS